MPKVFPPLFPDETTLSSEEIQSLLDSYAAQKKTGLLRLTYALDKRLYFLFKLGVPVNVYLVTPERWEEFSPKNSASWIRSAENASVKTLPLSLEGQRVVKTLIQSQNILETKILKNQEISTKIAEVKSSGEAALLRFRWQNASGAALIHGEESRFVFFSPKAALDEQGDCWAFYEWEEPECALTVFAPDLEEGAWGEYFLRRAFKKICDLSLARFETLAGQGLVESLSRLINLSASRQLVEIYIARGELIENELFASPRQALYNYRRMQAEMFEHFSSVIGSPLYVQTIKEAAAHLPPPEIQTLRKFELLPKGYLND